MPADGQDPGKIVAGIEEIYGFGILPEAACRQVALDVMSKLPGMFPPERAEEPRAYREKGMYDLGIDFGLNLPMRSTPLVDPDYGKGGAETPSVTYVDPMSSAEAWEAHKARISATQRTRSLWSDIRELSEEVRLKQAAHPRKSLDELRERKRDQERPDDETT